MAKINPEIETSARIKVIGVGGSGKNALNHMINAKVKGIEFVSINTDIQDLHNSLAEKKIHIGKNLTKGLGAGMNPDIGKRAAEETKSEIQDIIKGSDMVFIAGGMGGGTGTGGAPVVARLAKEQGILTVAVVTKPFFFEGNLRMRLAEKGIEELEQEVDAIICIPNDRLLTLAGKDTSFKDAFEKCDEVLRQAVEGISDLITTPGIINVDFADIKSIMSDAGSALMGIGISSGEGRAEKAAIEAINSPLLELSVNGAKGVLFAISAGDDLTLNEVQTAAKIITESIDKEAKVIFGTIKDERMKKGELKVTVIATGFPTDHPKRNTFQTQMPFTATTNTQTTAQEKKETVVMPQQTLSEKKDKETVQPVAPLQSDYLKKLDRKEIVIDATTETFEDDVDDEWNAIPAFLRRPKK
jgi:cell division protein FtsZ